jgi:hypothetical protein
MQEPPNLPLPHANVTLYSYTFLELKQNLAYANIYVEMYSFC